jgi:AcrR family transcriptional regulator
MDSAFSASKRSGGSEGAGRPRDQEARNAILRASLSLVKEFGYRSLTIDKIAQRAGTGKTTIYRWWPSKAAVVGEAFLSDISPEIAFPSVSAMSARESIRQQMRALARAFLGAHGDLLRALVAEAQFDSELSHALVNTWVKPRRALATEILNAGIASGELKSDINVNVAIDALYGGLYYRFLIPYAPLSSEFAGELADTVLNGLVQQNR